MLGSDPPPCFDARSEAEKIKTHLPMCRSSHEACRHAGSNGFYFARRSLRAQYYWTSDAGRLKGLGLAHNGRATARAAATGYELNSLCYRQNGIPIRAIGRGCARAAIVLFAALLRVSRHVCVAIRVKSTSAHCIWKINERFYHWITEGYQNVFIYGEKIMNRYVVFFILFPVLRSTSRSN